MPKVSVIIPVYGVERFIERCVDSLFNQTLDNIEFIFIDDCTPDNSISLLHAQIKKYQQRIDAQNWSIKLERMSVNSGLAAVRRYGISLATGQFVIHCDSDDWVDPDMYRLMYEKAISEGADMVVSDFVVTDGTSIIRNVKGCKNVIKELFIRDLLFQINPWSLCNKLFKRDTYSKGRIVYPLNNMGEDFVFTTQLLLNSDKISYIPRPLYFYFYNSESITRVQTEDSKMNIFWQNKQNADIIYKILENKGLTNMYSEAIISNKWYLKKRLWDTEFNIEKRRLWKEVYREINSNIVINQYIPLKEKIKFILTYMHLYPNKY